MFAIHNNQILRTVRRCLVLYFAKAVQSSMDGNDKTERERQADELLGKLKENC